MAKSVVQTEQAPRAIGPYAQAVAFGSLLFCSGQIGLDPLTGELVAGGATEQTSQVIRNLGAVLSAGGSALENVLKATVFLTKMSDFEAMNRVYEHHFTQTPARSTVEVSALPKNALVEIEVVAFVGGST